MPCEDEIIYRIWLSQCCGYNLNTAHKLLEKFGTAEEVYKANRYSLSFAKLVKLKNILRADTSLDGAKRILDKCRKNDIRVIADNDEKYPNGMREVNNPPLVLYSKGKLPDLNKTIGITIVGSRHCTDDGKKAAGALASKLADSGFVIVSGMAKGIDGAAHCGALSAGGTTLAVLAGGVDVIYPTEHVRLYQHIQEHGAILSERPPGTVGRGTFYNQRNRLIVGLSAGVVIAEGEKKSGTSITAKLAYDANRDVFAIPGNPINPFSELPNSLIADGAKVTINALDIIEEYVNVYPERLEYGISIKGKPVVGNPANLTVDGGSKPVKEKPVPLPPENKYFDSHSFEKFLAESKFSDTECKILRYLSGKENAVLFDDIADECEIETAALSSMLIILQMKKAVVQSAGGQYKLNLPLR